MKYSGLNSNMATPGGTLRSPSREKGMWDGRLKQRHQRELSEWIEWQMARPQSQSRQKERSSRDEFGIPENRPRPLPALLHPPVTLSWNSTAREPLSAVRTFGWLLGGPPGGPGRVRKVAHSLSVPMVSESLGPGVLITISWVSGGRNF